MYEQNPLYSHSLREYIESIRNVLMREGNKMTKIQKMIGKQSRDN